MLKFVSLLGPTAYKPCNYFLYGREEIKSKDCCYIQKAILDILKQENVVPDKIIVFTTQEAYDKNWDSNEWNRKEPEYNRPGLKNELIKFKEITGADFKNVIISFGTSEEDLWEIFSKILDEIDENDEIIFDITHSFRYLPILVFIAINYARIIKKCKLNAVYYGAFEVLGAQEKVMDIPIEERNAPIFDLTSFVDLFDWTIGIDRYLNTGDVTVINELIRNELKRISKKKLITSVTAKQDEHMTDIKTLFMDINLLKRLSKSMKEFSDVVFTCRGLKLTEIISRLKENLDKVKDNASKQQIIPLLPLIEMMKERFDKFSVNDDYINLIETVKWCADNKMYQQGLTILEEGLISYACEKFGYKDLSQKIKLKNREIIRSYAFVINNELGKKNKENGNICTINIISNDLTELLMLIDDIGNIRNDINHAGWREDPSSSDVFEKKLREFTSRSEKVIFNEYPNTKNNTLSNNKENGHTRNRRMLLIFSHELTSIQKENAVIQFEISEFLTLPSELQKKWSNVPPDLEDLQEYLSDIFKWIDTNAERGDYALVQGDFGVTYMTVNYCLTKGIIPVYSTTKRRVQEEKNGDKILALREFEHVMFRKYKF